VWATPLQALLLAERAALLSGRDEDFTMIVTLSYTGLRWGETTGLERGYVRQGELHVEWQLREVKTAFPRSSPSSGSGTRSPGCGLYAHASDRMRDELKAALQARWEESLSARAAIDTRSPVPLLDDLLAPHREATRRSAHRERSHGSRRHPWTGRR